MFEKIKNKIKNSGIIGKEKYGKKNLAMNKFSGMKKCIILV